MYRHEAAHRSVSAPSLAASCCVLLVVLCGPARADPVQDEAEDRLSAKDQRLVHGLIERGMPELVEELLADHPLAHHVYVARAYARAAMQTPDPAVRERFFKKASKAYRKVITLEEDEAWLRGLRRFVEVVQWRIELADMILRHWVAADLDRFEITSGLDYNRRRLAKRLRQAYEMYHDSAQTLDTLLIGLRTEEERFLLLGLGDKITTLHKQRRLNGGWAAVYLAMAADRKTDERERLLEVALGAFDSAARTAKDASRKYNALLGAGIALRESGRYTEANAAFDRVRDSTAPLALTARARYEKARSLVAAGRFEPARRELEHLASVSTERLSDEDAGAVFYVRLAPLIRAYSFALEAARTRAGSSRRETLREKSYVELEGIARRGGIWPGIVRVYLDTLVGAERGLAELTPSELRGTARRLMAEKDYAGAIGALQRLLDHPGATSMHAEARYNLGVCRFQAGDVRRAAVLFLAVARDEPEGDLVEKATETAYRCWRQVAHASRDADDFQRLVEASDLLVERFPDHALAPEAGWVGALARQEAGEYSAALQTYRKIPPTSVHHWEARRNIARCKQRIYETLPAGATLRRRSRAAQGAATEWTRLAEDLGSLDAQTAWDAPGDSVIVGIGSRSQLVSWMEGARLSAGSLLAGDDVRSYQSSLAVLADLKPTVRVLALRIRCHRGLGDVEMAQRMLDDFLKRASGRELGAVLIELGAEMETRIERLRDLGRHREAARAAEASLPTIRQLLSWIASRPEHASYVSVVRNSLARALSQAGHHAEAMALLEQLMAEEPANGNHIRGAALLQEDLAGRVAGSDREAALDLAESLWAKLLKDTLLREHTPPVYWEARYHWLTHQLRHGRPEEVVRGIETERAWHPNLGGPPWQARLLELAERAKTAKGAERP